ncbi:triacylglycerol lipase [Picosynechococcus sp. NKBG15041c]|uniref:esterase/lipase family protein n=1 Tax=Picosynechococcus sp. NKBG15041c TaxID=1407650 RepID=UPI00041B0707|nr:alpha/beta fold hydrolase [Picosynechococcus sp. NKBG15041c]
MNPDFFPNPVLLIHGFLDRQRVFNPLRQYLENRGRTVHAIDLKPNDGRQPLPYLAQQVQDYVHDTFAPEQRLDLVGFSMGGIVTRYYLQRLGGNVRVERYVSVSAPNQGTISAYSLPLPGIRQMRPNSELLQDLNQDVEIALGHIKVTCLWTPFDLMILPADSTKLPIGAEIQLPIPFHPWMLSDKRALRAIAHALKK